MKTMQGGCHCGRVRFKVTADLDPKIQEVGTTGERFVRQVYAELKSAR